MSVRRRFVVGIALAVIGVVCGTAAAENVEVDRLVLRDSQGRVRLELKINEYDNPVLVMYDPNGREVISLLGFAGWPGLTLSAYEGGNLKSVTIVYASNVAAAASYVPSVQSWRALKMTADQNVGGYALTTKLQKIGLIAHEVFLSGGPVQLRLQVNTQTQPSWNYHVGQGRFSVSDREVKNAYKEAGDYIVQQLVPVYFPDMKAENVEIEFYVSSYKVGKYYNGVMTLEGE